MSLGSLKRGLAQGLVRSKSLTSHGAKGKAKAKARVLSVVDPVFLKDQSVRIVWDLMSHKIASGSVVLVSLVGKRGIPFLSAAIRP